MDVVVHLEAGTLHAAVCPRLGGCLVDLTCRASDLPPRALLRRAPWDTTDPAETAAWHAATTGAGPMKVTDRSPLHVRLRGDRNGPRLRYELDPDGLTVDLQTGDDGSATMCVASTSQATEHANAASIRAGDLEIEAIGEAAALAAEPEAGVGTRLTASAAGGRLSVRLRLTRSGGA